MSTFSIGDAQLDYIDRGSGETVLLVHGSASDQRTWQGTIDALAERFRVVAYSRRHHWPNAPIEKGQDYSMDRHVDDLAAVLARIGEGPVHVVGHSYGALVALLLAIRDPSWFRSMVVIEPPVVSLFISDPPTAREVVRMMLTHPRIGLGILKFGAVGRVPAVRAAKDGDMDKVLAAFGPAVLGREAFDDLSPDRMAQVRDNTFAEEFLSSFPRMAASDLQNLHLPMLVLDAADSPAVWSGLCDYLAELLPGASRCTVPGASHIAHEDNPAAFVTYLEQFLVAHGK